MFAGGYLPDRQAAGRTRYGDVPAQHLMELQRGLGEGPASMHWPERKRVTRTAIAARETIGPAIGVRSESYYIDTDSAFQALRQASQATNIKVVELAADILQTRQVPEAVARTVRALQAFGRPDNES